jgi:hypothetical protein
MKYMGSNILVPPWGLVVTYPQAFGAVPMLIVTANDVTKSAVGVMPSASQFTAFVFDSMGNSTGGLISYSSTDGLP